MLSAKVEDHIAEERETVFRFGRKYFSHDLIPPFFFDE